MHLIKRMSSIITKMQSKQPSAGNSVYNGTSNFLTQTINRCERTSREWWLCAYGWRVYLLTGPWEPQTNFLGFDSNVFEPACEQGCWLVGVLVCVFFWDLFFFAVGLASFLTGYRLKAFILFFNRRVSRNSVCKLAWRNQIGKRKKKNCAFHAGPVNNAREQFMKHKNKGMRWFFSCVFFAEVGNMEMIFN